MNELLRSNVGSQDEISMHQAHSRQFIHNQEAGEMRKSLSAPKSERKAYKRHQNIDDMFANNELDGSEQMALPFNQLFENLDLGKIQEASRDSENSCTISKPRLTLDEQVVVKESIHKTRKILERNASEQRCSTGDYAQLQMARGSTGDLELLQARLQNTADKPRESTDAVGYNFQMLTTE